MSDRVPLFAFLTLLAGCGSEPPETVHVGAALLRFPRHDFYQSITDDGASRPSFVSYMTPEEDNKQSITLEYDEREKLNDRIAAQKKGIPYVYRASYRLEYYPNAFIVKRPWGSSICLRDMIKVGGLGSCATNVTYRNARWNVYFQYEMLDNRVNVIERALLVLKAYTIEY